MTTSTAWLQSQGERCISIIRQCGRQEEEANVWIITCRYVQHTSGVAAIGEIVYAMIHGHPLVVHYTDNDGYERTIDWMFNEQDVQRNASFLQGMAGAQHVLAMARMTLDQYGYQRLDMFVYMWTTGAGLYRSVGIPPDEVGVKLPVRQKRRRQDDDEDGPGGKRKSAVE